MAARTATGHQRAAWAFMGPGLVLVVLAMYIPVVYTAFLSLTSYSGLGSPRFVGLANYTTMLTDPSFLSSVLNTVLWVVGTLLVPVGFGLVVAYLSFGLPWAGILRIPFL